MLNDLGRFILVGIVSNVINYGVYIAIVRFGGAFALASFLGYMTGLLNSYYFGKIWVFESRGSLPDRKSNASEMIRFGCVYAIGAIEMSAITFGLVRFAGVDYRLSWLFAASFAFVNNFSGSKWFVFSYRK